MPLKRWVAARAPRSKPAVASAYVASVWPIATTTPSEAAVAIEVERPRQFGGDDDHLHAPAARVKEPAELRVVRRAEVADVERARALGADERALEMAAEDLRALGPTAAVRRPRSRAPSP